MSGRRWPRCSSTACVWACGCSPIPRVIYGLGERYDGNIHTRDLETDTPYNTYTRAGLPPTPIALPGAASLQATLAPGADRRAVLRGHRQWRWHRITSRPRWRNTTWRCARTCSKLGVHPAARSRCRPRRGRIMTMSATAEASSASRASRARANRPWRARSRRRCARVDWRVLLTREPGGTPLAERLRARGARARRRAHQRAGRDAADVCGARDPPGESDPSGAAGRQVGDLRSLHRCHARLSGCRARGRSRS